MFNKKPTNSHGRGKGIIPFAVGTVLNAKLLGYVYAPIAAEKQNKKLLTFLAEQNSTEDEKVIDDAFASNPQFEDMCYLAVIIEVNGNSTQTIDIGFKAEGTPVKVVDRPYKDSTGAEKPGKAYEVATVAELKAYEKANLQPAS